MICRGVARCSVIDVIFTPEEHLLRAIIASVDVLPIILEFLPLKEILRSRRVCKQWREAARKTIVPDIFYVKSVTQYNILRSMVTVLPNLFLSGMVVMARAMPNLEQITIGGLEYGHKWSDGEDPDEAEAARTDHLITHDIEIISNFSKLQVLGIKGAGLNGRYPFMFNFPLLQKLIISDCHHLKFDLEMLAGMHFLKQLDCSNNRRMTGNINSLRVLKDTLEKVYLQYCYNVEGNFMDLADFPHLKKLDLLYTDVTGDIRDIGDNDFSSLEHLKLPKGVYGGNGYELQHISDAHDLVRAVYLFRKQRPALKMGYWYGTLSEDSPDWYDSRVTYPIVIPKDAKYWLDFVNQIEDTPPFFIHLVQAGSRNGYRWQTKNGIPCEVNWLDPAPDRESFLRKLLSIFRENYSKYIDIDEFRKIDSVELEFFQGIHQPPTLEELHRLLMVWTTQPRKRQYTEYSLR